MLTATSFNVLLDSPEAILYGGPGEAGGTLVTGRVTVAAKHASQLTSLVVTLRPQRARLFQAQHPVAPEICLQAVLVSHGLTPPQIMHRDISGKEHEWRFSIGIPGSTAETVFSNANFVAYEVVAQARAPGTLTSVVQSKAVPIAIKRAPAIDSQWAHLASEPITESAVWKERLDLTLTVPSRIIYDQQTLSVRGVIRPLVKGMSLVRAGFQITERISQSIGALGRAHSFAVQNVIVDNSVDIPGSQSAGNAATASRSHSSDKSAEKAGLALIEEISISRSLSVPEAYTGIQYDIRRGPIRVSHELSLFVTVADAAGRLQNLRLATSVFVMPMSTRKRIDLPRYEDTAADELVESGVGEVAQRDEDFMSEYVLVETINHSEPGSIECRNIEPTDTCPLALDGYQCLDNVRPPPAYPGACAASVERTLVLPEAVLPEAVLPRQAHAPTNRIRKLCSRARLRPTVSESDLPPIPQPQPRHAAANIAADALFA
ncbi:hypothetical protein GGH91_000871 [Coemansia sp. RSA 2671]|nr:hypothetical protein LPJ60_000328 [Coemansia sp. RSA 2675]KAJ2349332.1 hypothetical protein GGH91_000871 [Coemansia sp. RSA 2671]